VTRTETAPAVVPKMNDSLSLPAAMLFDLDGTLYAQPPVRVLMAMELAALPLRSGSVARSRRTWAILRAFRRIREEMRDWPCDGCLEERQYGAVASRLGVSPDAVRRAVEEWMFTRPLRYLRPARRPGLRSLLVDLQRKGVRLGVFSDYPVDDKLSAMGLKEFFSVRLCATDPDINAFKPNPRGYLEAARRWGLQPADVLYVGDRPEIDAAGARAAGMPCVIISRGRASGGLGEPEFVQVTSFGRLARVITAG
jgi:HAD superfamily hydrolase (TIGR01509 family)